MNNTIKSFTSTYIKKTDCFLEADYYGNGNPALELISPVEGPIAVLTVNPGIILEDGTIAIKDYSENDGVAEELVRLGILGRRLGVIPSGFVDIPVYELSETGLNLWKF